MKHYTLAALASLISATAALAGPAGDKAQSHFDAIAKGDVAAIMSGYGEGATLNWVGGQLDGVYTGDKLKEVWSKFVTVAGSPLKVAATNVQESANPKGATVTANVVFTGKAPVKVRYVLVYRDDKLVSEIWQIDPNRAD